jgi:hypothetical protein
MPGYFKLEIELNNAAFEPFPGVEISRIVAEVAREAELMEGSELDEYSKVLMDINGNRVGMAWCLWRSHEEVEDGPER